MLHQPTVRHNDDKVCSKTLLTIVAKGSAIITELHRLIELVPAPFKHNYDVPTDASQYLDKEKRFSLNDLICDFSYFKSTEAFEAKIEQDEILKKADEDLCDNFIDILTRFYLTFESIQSYAADLNNFISELEEETFVGQSLDQLLLDLESRQLLCEAYFLLGYMLITTDSNFEGGLRERLIVSYYRYSSYKSSPGSSLDDTCNLMRSTGFKSIHQQIYKTSSAVQYHRPVGYPETFFARVKVNQTVVNLLIAKLQSVDIYNQSTTTFPHPDHRSTALAAQASILYVLLYFCPNILITQRSRMRELTDKFFYDNWIISIHMGDLVNLIEAWDPYKAAKESLIQLLELESIHSLVNQYNLKFFRVQKQFQDFLKEAWLNEDSVLENNLRILNSIREGNVILKWLLLHSITRSDWQLKLTKLAHSVVVGNHPGERSMYYFLQNLSELEKRFSSICKNILQQKEDKMHESRIKASETLSELVEIFNDTKPMRWIQPGANLKLSSLISGAVSNLKAVDFSSPNSRDLIINIVNELESMRDSYSDGKNLQVVQLFSDTRESLLKVLRHFSITSDLNILIHTISDFSFAWRIMDQTFTSHMQQIIRDDPLKLYGLESVFLKLASTFDTHLIRIQQVNSQEDLISVYQYYSTKLVSYIRDVLHIIPATILELLCSIVSIQTEHVMGDIPAKIPLDNLKDYSLPEKRLQMLELTYKVSHYAESMLMMQGTTVGLIRINSKQLLEDGIRRELVRRMSDSIQEILQFSDSTNLSNNIIQMSQNLLSKLTKLDSAMKGYKRSLEYIQDYLFIYGLRMWQEELCHIIKFNVEQASEILLSGGIVQNGYSSQFLDHHSIYQSSKISIPIYDPNPLRSSFIVRILNELLRITDPRSTIYDDQMSAWYEQKSPRNNVLDLKIFESLASSLGVAGLNGIDQMCCTLLMLELKKLDTFLLTLFTNKSSLQTQGLLEALISLNNLSEEDNSDARNSFSAAVLRIAPFSDHVINHLLRIGQLQAIRTNISCVLSTNCRYEARNLYYCLESFNTTLLSTLKYGKRLPNQQKPDLDSSSHEINNDELTSSSIGGEDNLEDSQLIFELTNHLDWIGLSDPMSKIYTLALQTSNNSQVHEFREQLVAMDLMFLILLDQCSKFSFSRSISGFVPKISRSFLGTSYSVDGQPLFYGLITFINHSQPFLSTSRGFNGQFAPLKRLLGSMSVYVRCSIDQLATSGSCKPQDLTLEVMNMILSIIELVRLSRQSPERLLSKTLLPQFVFDTLQYTVCHLEGSLVADY